ncbi:MAG: glutaredoxin-like protein NrdH [Gordonia polyisoprenivorans]|nr:glutaredoxin-like protein NrdH [Gordonia polyisoprenivorans]
MSTTYSPAAIVVYSKPACVQCTATYKALDKHGIAYTTIDITENPDAREYVLALGYLAAPVVVTGDTHWSGYRPNRIRGLSPASSEKTA